MEWQDEPEFTSQQGWGELYWTRHARCRAAQRIIRQSHIDCVLEYGKATRRHGAIRYSLEPRDISRDLKEDENISRAIGVVVIMAGSIIITAYRRTRGQMVRRQKRRRNVRSHRRW